MPWDVSGTGKSWNHCLSYIKLELRVLFASGDGTGDQVVAKGPQKGQLIIPLTSTLWKVAAALISKSYHPGHPGTHSEPLRDRAKAYSSHPCSISFLSFTPALAGVHRHSPYKHHSTSTYHLSCREEPCSMLAFFAFNVF